MTKSSSSLRNDAFPVFPASSDVDQAFSVFDIDVDVAADTVVVVVVVVVFVVVVVVVFVIDVVAPRNSPS